MLFTSMFIAATVATSPYRPVPAEKSKAVKSLPNKVNCGIKSNKMTAKPNSARGVPNLPHAFGNKFETLDSYLAHLQCHAAPIDLPWWHEISPGVFKRMTTATNAKREIATREQLELRYGFRK